MQELEALLPDLYKSDDEIRVINEDSMKSAEGKKKWREFITKYEKKGMCAR